MAIRHGTLRPDRSDSDVSSWTFLSHHAQVLLCISRDPDARLREIASAVGITERAVQAIVNDLVEAGYVGRTRVGRRNHYSVNAKMPMRHRLQHDLDAGTLLRLMG
jgi:DNA-binding MarR family transcriptional regulator